MGAHRDVEGPTSSSKAAADHASHSEFFELDETAFGLCEAESEDDIFASDLENDEKVREEPLWSVDDDTLFQPSSLICHCSADQKRSIFFVWDDTYLLSFHFKKSKHSKRIDMTKVRLPIPDGTEVRELHILEFNTLLITTAGSVYYFSSVKSLWEIDWLCGVRCFSPTENGFAIIRNQQPDNRLMLQLYDDVANLCQKGSALRCTYDITYNDENIFNSEWQDERNTLISYKISASGLHFMQCIIGNECELHEDQVVYIFTITGHVFALIPNEAETSDAMITDDTTNYHIELISVYASPVLFIKLLPQKNMCLVFLTCGSIDILYVSQLLQIKQKQTHNTGCEFLDYDASCDNGDFYYTDGERVTRLQFSYLSATDDCFVQEYSRDIPGMLACTWVQNIKQLVCLSANNIFYRIAFLPPNKNENEPGALGVLSELTPAMISRLYRNVKFMEEFMHAPAKLHADIEEEYLKQQLVAAALKADLFEDLLIAELTYTRQIPLLDGKSALLWTSSDFVLNANAAFAIFEIKLLLNNEIFETLRGWQLYIQANGKVTVLCMPDEVYEQKSCTIVLPLSKGDNSLLPDFRLRMARFLQVNSQTRAILLPVKVKEQPTTYAALFSECQVMKSLRELPDWKAVFNYFKPKKENAAASQLESFKIITHKLALPDVSSLKQILQLFHCFPSADVNVNSKELYFLGSKLSISFDGTTKTASLTSTDPTALLYARLHLLLNCMGNPNTAQNNKTKLAQIIKFQCDIEKFYGTQARHDDLSSDSHDLDDILSSYAQLRKELY